MGSVKLEWLERRMICCPHLALVTTEEQYLKAARYCGIKTPPTFLTHRENHDAFTTNWENKKGGHPVSVVGYLIDENRSMIETHATLMHEAVHVAQYWFEFIGERNPSEEFEAYTIEHIATVLMKSYEKQAAEAKKLKEKNEKHG